MKQLIFHLAAALVFVGLLLAVAPVRAAQSVKQPSENKATTQKKSASEKKSTANPNSTTYRGTVSSLDKLALTITLTNKTQPARVFQVTSETRFYKKDKPATLSDLVIGDVVGGSYYTNGTTLTLLTVRDAGPEVKGEKSPERKAAGTTATEKKAANNQQKANPK